MNWDAVLYDQKHNFVADYGKGLLEFVPRNAEQAILDVGCGTGTLTAQLAKMGKTVIGIDNSETMIQRAKKQAGRIEFAVCDALALPFEEAFDVVFSNAVFHWISDHAALLRSIRRALKPQGVLICEFGVKGNIAAIESAFARACDECGYSYGSPFNFPSAESFGQMLEAHGFVVDTLYEYDRPTPLQDGEQGLRNWLRQFFAADFARMPDSIRERVLERVEDMAGGRLWNGQAWVADYRRLRAVARKL